MPNIAVELRAVTAWRVTKAVGPLVIVILMVVVIVVVVVVVILMVVVVVVVVVIIVIIITVVIVVIIRIGRPARRCIHWRRCRSSWGDHRSRGRGDNGSRGSNLSVLRSCRFCRERFADRCGAFKSGGCDADAWGLRAVLLEENVACIEQRGRILPYKRLCVCHHGDGSRAEDANDA
jgi:uncharacterized membrane protein YgcG